MIQVCPHCLSESSSATPDDALFVVCEHHNNVAGRTGSEDILVNQETMLSGSGEAGGDSNKMWCDAFHRGKWPRIRKKKPPVIVSPTGRPVAGDEYPNEYDDGFRDNEGVGC